MIEVKGLTKSYGSLLALDHVNLTVSEGKITGILGPNGAGKSTFFNILSTSILPTSGTVLYNGKDIISDPKDYRKDLGVVFQSTVLDQEESAYQNLYTHCAVYGVKKPFAPVIMKALEEVGLKDKAKVTVSKFSGGMKRRLELAKCLLTRPKIIILDEPTTGLDVVSRKEIWEAIKKSHEENHSTIFLATHYIEEASICDNIVIVNKGKILKEGSPEELINTYSIPRVMLTLSPGAAFELKGYKYEIKDDKVIIDVKDNIAKTLKDALEASDAVINVSITHSSLEEAYLNLTGGTTSSSDFTEVK